MIRKPLLFFLSLLLSAFAMAQEPAVSPAPFDTSFFEMSLEQLMNVEISVASRKALTPRESSGIVTLITEDEIKNSGAQDLMDVLKWVPGFEFGSDVEGAVGLGIRGNWAHEGKILLVIDGQEMNEQMYSTLQFGNHYPVDQVKRIEIIRGPGSAVYGGNAEYAVINIVTVNNKEFTGITAVASYGQMKETYSKRNVSISAGKHFGDVALNIGLLAGEGNRSDREYTDYLGNTTSLRNKQALDPTFLNVAASYKDFSLRFISDVYHTTTIDGYEELMQQPYDNDFKSSYFEAKYRWKINEKLTVVPRFNFKRQTPWNFTGNSLDGEYEVYDRTASQPHYEITCNYDANEKLNLHAGAEYYEDRATDNAEGGTFTNGEKNVCYSNTAMFAQALWKTRIANFALGARFHNNSIYEPAFVPRLGITRVIDRFHAKLLFSKAYRAPGIENIDHGINIRPENTTVAEFETGYQFNDFVFLSVNAYDITTRNTLVYYYDNGDAYQNLGSTGTRGIETELIVKGKKAYAEINYSFYTTQGKKSIDNYAAGQNTDVLLAFPAHKINFSGSLKITGHLSLNGSVSWSGTRYAFTGKDSVTSLNNTQAYAPLLISNLYVNISDILCDGFSVGLGCHNLTDENEIYIQPYNSYHSPLPGASRELYIKLAIQVK